MTDMGRLSMAAKHLKDIGELYEKEARLLQLCEHIAIRSDSLSDDSTYFVIHHVPKSASGLTTMKEYSALGGGEVGAGHRGVHAGRGPVQRRGGQHHLQQLQAQGTAGRCSTTPRT